MKIAILTLPFHSNYGGILQAYALQTVLKRMDNEVVIVDLPLKKEGYKVVLLTYLKRFIAKYFFLSDKPLRAWASEKELKVINKNILNFINKYLLVIKCNKLSALPALIKQEQINVFVFGSDQIWRPSYTPDVYTYFGSFLSPSSNIKKISYAASFGVDFWEYTPKQTLKCKGLVKTFKAVSVREDSAVHLCRQYLDINAVPVLDPTMLLNKDDYVELLKPYDNCIKKELAVYLLDCSKQKKDLIDKIVSYKELDINYINVQNKYWNVGSKKINECIVPPVENWLRGLLCADFVITDSFHGVVFSILFHKQFYCIVNSMRGSTRFISLLRLLNLEDRIVSDIENFDLNNLDKDIDYSIVDSLLSKEREKSMDFLRKALAN